VIIRAELVAEADAPEEETIPLAEYASAADEPHSSAAAAAEGQHGDGAFDFDGLLPPAQEIVAPVAPAPVPQRAPQAAASGQRKPQPAKAARNEAPTSSGLSTAQWMLMFSGGGLGSGVVVGLVLLGLISLFSGSGGAADSLTYTESPSLMRELRAFRMGHAAPMSEEQIQKTLVRYRKVFPNFMKTTRAEERRLAAGKSDPATAAKLAALRRVIRDKINFDAHSEEFELHMFAAQWRTLLMLRATPDDKWAETRDIEDQVFGEQSLFKLYSAAEFEPLREGIRLQGQLDKIASAITGLERTTGGRSPRFDGMLPEQTKGLSWRVAILPYIGKSELYNEFVIYFPFDIPN
jgi:hypothetical protein